MYQSFTPLSGPGGSTFGLAIKRLRRKPHVITACFAEAAGYP